jgi:hypothetical protein
MHTHKHKHKHTHTHKHTHKHKHKHTHTQTHTQTQKQTHTHTHTQTHTHIYNLRSLKFTLKHLKRSYMFRSHDHPQGAWIKIVRINLFFIDIQRMLLDQVTKA